MTAKRIFVAGRAEELLSYIKHVSQRPSEACSCGNEEQVKENEKNKRNLEESRRRGAKHEIDGMPPIPFQPTVQ